MATITAATAVPLLLQNNSEIAVRAAFNLLVDGIVRLTSIAKERSPEEPFILLGHS